MAGQLGTFQSVGPVAWKGLTKSNHLGAIYGKCPQKVSNYMVEILALRRGRTLDTLLNKYPTKEFDNTEEYFWEVVGSSRRNIPLVEARDENGVVVTNNGAMVGAGTAPFYLVFGEDWWADGEYIVGNLNEIYQFRILGDARNEGSNYVYKVELAGGNTNGIPAERLLAGERFSREAAFVESSFSRKVGDVRFAAPTTMRNEWSTIRKQHKVGGDMMNQKFVCGIPVIDKNNGKSKTISMWIPYVEWQFEQEFQEEKYNALAFGRSNRNSNGEYMTIGKSGNVIKTGAGLYQQMEAGNTKYYNEFSLKMLEDALYRISASKLDMDDRQFVIMTGERGAMAFHKAVLDTISGWTPFTINGDQVGVVAKTSSPLHSNALKAGFQFTEFLAPNGVKVKLEVNPYYDDPVRNKIQFNGGPAFSSRFDIMYIGKSDQPNIFKCKVKGVDDIRGYQFGLRNPFTGEHNNMHMSFDEDAAVMHRFTQFGICVLDPTRSMSLIPAVLMP